MAADEASVERRLLRGVRKPAESLRRAPQIHLFPAIGT